MNTNHEEYEINVEYIIELAKSSGLTCLVIGVDEDKEEVMSFCAVDSQEEIVGLAETAEAVLNKTLEEVRSDLAKAN